MPRFRVRAVDRSGTRVSIVSVARDASTVRTVLGEREWTILSVAPVRGDLWRQTRLRWQSRRYGIVLLRQLGELLRVGVPMDEALLELQRLAPRGPLSDAWQQVHRAVERGDLFVDALSVSSGLLAERHLAALSVGQSRQDLAKALIEVSDELAWRADVLQRWQRASSYPLIALLLLLCVSGFLLTSVVPSLEPLLQPVITDLPWVTQRVVLLSNSTEQKSFWLNIAGGVTSGVLTWLLCCQILGWKKRVKPWLLHQCLKGAFANHWVWPFAVAAHANTIRLLLNQNIPLPQAVVLAAPAAGLFGTQNTWLRIAHSVEQGGSFADAVEQAELVPRLYVSLVRVGESHGTMKASLAMASTLYHERAVQQLQRLDTLISPFLLIFVGTFMAGVVVWLVLPVYDAVALYGNKL